ncbi:endonuclease/exonuclease/phosphatase family protein [Vibrio owensii]|uniref:endonuclease/exonuclease/phosphatase family protein n=1 Tax=Vibrio owensii TaxID=696485 RepID=UPI003AAD096D
MKYIKTPLALLVGAALLTGCNDDTTNNYYPSEPPVTVVKDVKFAAFNLSFDRNTYEDLVEEMKLTAEEQEQLIQGWKDDTLNDADKAKAEKVIQIRNVAAIIQHEKPAVLLMAEFNNDGEGKDVAAITGFRLNYLAVPQSLNSIDGGDLQEPIAFPYFENYATNTGLQSGYDLDRNGSIGGANDAWGYGTYHGQYAFALISQFPIDKENTRTFQNFKWSDMPGETNPVIVDCDDNGLTCGEEWYSEEAWANMPLSSKNHVDAPIKITKEDGTIETVHVLMSHPTPPIFNNAAMHNKIHNRAEIDFWVDYVSGGDTASYIYDDKGTKGGLADGSKFVVMGDLNADPLSGDGDLTAINDLMNHKNVNTNATFGTLAPSSWGGPECLANGECKAENWDTPYPNQVTSTSGLRLDHVIPSSEMNVVDSAVFWPASFEDGRKLMNDDRIGYGNAKSISSDHRLVSIKVEL